MSYYFKYSYNFSSHGLQRCKERLKMQTKSDFEIKTSVMALIKNSNHSFESRYDLYIRAGSEGNLYFVINKANNLIVTCTPVSVEKQLSLWGN